MTDPTERPDPGSINDATQRAVQADRARVVAAEQVARRRRRSLAGRFERGSRWLRNRQSGPLPRLRRVGSVVRAAIHDHGPWRALPEAIATALLAPVRLPGKPPPPAPPRSWVPERAAAAARLAAAAEQLRATNPRDLRVAAIADATELAALNAACRVTAIRPEDWATELEAAEAAGTLPELLLVASARNGNGGAWTYRIAWTAHPDSLLHRDLRAVVDWCSARAIPSVFAVGELGGSSVADWVDAACLFDLVLVPDRKTADVFETHPDRRGVGARITAPGASVADVLRMAGTTS